MALKVVCFCGYLANRSMRWRSEDYDSYKWVQALKGKELNKYAQVTVRGTIRRLSNENLADAIQWFGEFVEEYLQKEPVKGPFLVVPVPNSSCLMTSSARPRTRRLAKAVCDQLEDGSKVLDCLRWKKNLGSASAAGGPREAEILYANLNILSNEMKGLNEKAAILLVDDVITSGGHLRACVARLKKAGLSVDLAFCGGKTVYDQKQRAFSVYEDSLNEYRT